MPDQTQSQLDPATIGSLERINRKTEGQFGLAPGSLKVDPNMSQETAYASIQTELDRMKGQTGGSIITASGVSPSEKRTTSAMPDVSASLSGTTPPSVATGSTSKTYTPTADQFGSVKSILSQLGISTGTYADQLISEAKRNQLLAIPKESIFYNPGSAKAAELGVDPNSTTGRQIASVEEDRLKLEQEKKQQLETTQASFDSLLRNQETSNRLSIAKDREQMLRMGANTSVGGISYIAQRSHQLDLNIQDIEVKRQTALNKIETAFIDKNFELASLELDKVDALQKNIQTERSKALEDAQKFLNIQKDIRENLSDNITSLVGSGISSDDLPSGYLQSLDDGNGLPRGTSALMWSTAEQAKIAQDSKDDLEKKKAQIEASKGLLDIAERIPPGKTWEVPFGDTKLKIEGMKETKPNTFERFVTDPKTGQYVYLSVDRNTNKATTVNIPVNSGEGWETKFQDGKILNYNTITGEQRIVTDSTNIPTITDGQGYANALIAQYRGTLTQNPFTPVDYIKGRTVHGGWDIALPENSPLPTPVEGRVIEAGFVSGWGGTVVVRDSSGKLHRWAHMNSLSVSMGDFVSSGSMVGLSGSTGTSTGPHVHYEITDANGNPILNAPGTDKPTDPKFYADLAKLVKQVNNEDISKNLAFMQLKNSYKNLDEATIQRILDDELGGSSGGPF